jgi:hypothetical protein
MTLAVYLPLLLPVLVARRRAVRRRPARPGRRPRPGRRAAVTRPPTIWSLLLLFLTLFDDLPAMLATTDRLGAPAQAGPRLGAVTALVVLVIA